MFRIIFLFLGSLAFAAASMAQTSGPSYDFDSPYSVKFSEPLTVGAPVILGKSIEQLIKGSPVFAPIEGLPDSYWKRQECSNCHKWTRDDLCKQGQFYLKQTDDILLDKKHPLGGTFKRNLVVWARDDCQ